MFSTRELQERAARAVRGYWRTRRRQARRQKKKNSKAKRDKGGRASATGGRQMDGFAQLIQWVARSVGLPEQSVRIRSKRVLPGVYRPTKDWDVLIVHHGDLLAAIEFKSQAGPSFGKNFNNRAEEAVGTTKDAWDSFEAKPFAAKRPPWVGWLMLLEDCAASTTPKRHETALFSHHVDFGAQSSYSERYALLLRRLRNNKLLNEGALVLSKRRTGEYREHASDLGLEPFMTSLAAHLKIAHAISQQKRI